MVVAVFFCFVVVDSIKYLKGSKNMGESSKMKIFHHYNPVQIAKYVKTLFRGRLYIKDVGAFEFDYGKILLPKVRDKQHFSVMSEVNRQVISLQAEMA
jgi:hypothetical protein